MYFFFFFPFLFSMLVNFSQEMYVCRSSVDFDERKRGEIMQSLRIYDFSLPILSFIKNSTLRFDSIRLI